MTVSKAFAKLQEIRNEVARYGSNANFKNAIQTINEIGCWAGSECSKRYTKKLDQLCRECNEMFNKYSVR